MQARRFDLTGADYSKMGKKNNNGKITYYDSDSTRTAVYQGKCNEALSQTSLSSDTDLTNIVFESKESLTEFTTDGETIHVSNMGLRYNKWTLTTELEKYYNTKVESKRACFHQEMTEIERKVNDILRTVHSLDSKLCFQKMHPSCFYEIKGSNEIDVFLVLEDIIDWNHFSIEEVSDEGYVRIRRQLDTSVESHMNSRRTIADPQRTGESLGNFCIKSNSGCVYFSAKAIGRQFKDLVRRSFECLPSQWMNSWPECKLNSQVYQLAGPALERTRSLQKYFAAKRVSFQEKQRYNVNLIPTIVCRNYWPQKCKWSSSSEWPDHALLTHTLEQGVHLVAMSTNKDQDDLWRVKFFHAQRLLNNITAAQCKQKCLRIVKVLCERQLRFSRHFLPYHLENIALQLYEQNPRDSDWADDMLAIRFLEFLVKIFQALKSHRCMHYYLPQINLFSEIPEHLASRLAKKTQDILHDPVKYLI